MKTTRLYRDRIDAGERLAPLCERFRKQRPIVLALPRGGVPVGYVVARALGAPLELLIVRKLGAPFQPELGMGAVAEGGGVFVDQRIVELVGARDEDVGRIAQEERREIDRRVEHYRGGRPLPDLHGRTVIVVDDGIATGGTMRAAARAAKAMGARKVVLATPVASADVVDDLEDEADEVISAETPESLWAIGAWYEDFHQILDEEVLGWLARAGAAPPAAEPGPPPSTPPGSPG